MHELLLFGPVPENVFSRTLNQLAGVSRMRPQRVVERHLIFRAIPPVGLNEVQIGGSQTALPPDLKKTQAMLGGGLFYLHLVGRHDLKEEKKGSHGDQYLNSAVPSWTIEFKDIPDAGSNQQVTARLTSKTAVEHGSAVQFMQSFGYEYISQYALEGFKVYDQNTTLFLHRVLVLSTESGNISDPASDLPSIDRMTPLDSSGSYIFQASIDLADSNSQELRRRGTEELLAIKETFRGAVALQPADRFALNNFFKPASEKEPDKLQWRIVGKSLIVGNYTVKENETSKRWLTNPAKIAAFDLDDTLIVSTAGKFTKSATGWKWWDSSVPARLRELNAEGFRLVILTNQSTISLKDDPKIPQRDKASFRNFKDQLTSVLRQLDLPVSVYAATEKDGYRKPRDGMWRGMLEDSHLEAEDAVDLSESVFVGDAAGREKIDGRAKDHSSCDRDLAANVRINFKTPEEFFLYKPSEPFTRAFEPSQHLTPTDALTPSPVFEKRNELGLVIFCGSPGAGKSTFYWDHLQKLGYERVNQDILKSRDKCLKVAEKLLQEGTSVAVDNTNADIETRKLWVNLAQKVKMPIRCVHFTASSRLCEHNDAVRSFNVDLVIDSPPQIIEKKLTRKYQMNPEKRAILPPMAFRGFAARYQEPTVKEGFQDIIKVDFKVFITPFAQSRRLPHIKNISRTLTNLLAQNLDSQPTDHHMDSLRHLLAQIRRHDDRGTERPKTSTQLVLEREKQRQALTSQKQDSKGQKEEPKNQNQAPKSQRQVPKDQKGEPINQRPQPEDERQEIEEQLRDAEDWLQEVEIWVQVDSELSKKYKEWGQYYERRRQRRARQREKLHS
ncbi:MAG: hypothetical protein Q9227_006598 [Pyrenula ochraceoflavens]